MIAAGAVVEAGSTVSSGELWAGNPARRVRELKQEEKDYLDTLPDRWVHSNDAFGEDKLEGGV
jgi:carbonic anhydrase/acetyltransferase-like protein (isoleucine patch superfamily)